MTNNKSSQPIDFSFLREFISDIDNKDDLEFEQFFSEFERQYQTLTTHAESMLTLLSEIKSDTNPEGGNEPE